MTPAGHFSASYITGKSSNYFSLPAIIIGGVLPDIDFIFLFFDWFNQVHRLTSHNLLFIILASLIAAAFASGGRRVTIGLSLFMGAFMHLMFDSVMDNNPSNGLGIALLWPFSAKFFSPFNLLELSASPSGWKEPLNMIKTLVPGLLYEVPLYVMAAFLYFKKTK